MPVRGLRISRQYFFSRLPPGVFVGFPVEGEGGREAAVEAFGLVKDRDMRLEALLIDQPAQHLARSIGGVGNQRVGMQAEAILGADQHFAHGPDLSLAHGRGRLHIHDDGVIQIDQIVGAEGEEGLSSFAPVKWAAGSLGDRILGCTAVAAPSAASSMLSRYSGVARATF
jgi:hypothetical protein